MLLVRHMRWQCGKKLNLSIFEARFARLMHTGTEEGRCCAGDSIRLKGLVFHGYHGVLPEENTLGQKFLVDATMYTNLRNAGNSDNLHDTIDYAKTYSMIKNIVEGKPHNLIESVAERIAQDILQESDMVESVRIRIEKPHVAVPGVVDSLGIEIYRQKQ